MPINLQNEQNIGTGWPAPPKLDAPNIGGVLGEILQQRRWQQAQTQKSIADTIKNLQSQREEQAYTDALQKAGLLPEGDYGGLGIKGGTSLATMIQRKQALDALAAHRTAMEARVGGRGRGGGGGGEAGYPETTWDEQGREWRRGPSGRWIPVAPVKVQQPPGPKLSAKEQGWAAPEIPGVSVDVNAPDEPGKFLPPDFTGPPGPPSVPPLLQRPPDTAPTSPPITSGPPPSDSAAGHAPTYGVAPSRDAAKPGQSYIAPDGSIRVKGNN